MKNAVVVFLGVMLLLCIGAGEPGQQATPRLITVTGQSEVNVVPDEVVITLGVETLDKKLSAAKTQNDVSVKKILALAPQYQIDPKYVQTSQISIYPRYESGSWSGRNFVGYEVEKTIVFILKDVSKFEEFLSGVLEAGANNVRGVQFRTSELRKYKDQARAMAVKAAREKAVAVSAELGQKVGKPYTIKEEEISYYGDNNFSNSQVSRDSGQGAETGEGTIALGQISVKAKFTVSFELE
ncbi:MAG: SIMPL domain-containing protein [Candidatus Brocadiia bacterium]